MGPAAYKGGHVGCNQPDLARAQVTKVLADDAHGPAYQRKRDRVWVRHARGLLRKLG